jgi:predicted methyltransferase
MQGPEFDPQHCKRINEQTEKNGKDAITTNEFKYFLLYTEKRRNLSKSVFLGIFYNYPCNPCKGLQITLDVTFS